MKNLFCGIFLVFSVYANAQSAGDRIVFHYLKLAKALSQSDFQKASRQAGLLGKECRNPEFSGMNASAAAMEKAENLTVLREKFSPFSDSLFSLIQTGRFRPSEELFLVHCPMAFQDKGANWISDEPKVINPYFGDEMLHCGSVKTKIKSSNK